MPTPFTFYGHPIPPAEAIGTLQKLYDELEAMLGEVMPHIQIHATHALDDMEHYVATMKMTRSHPEIPLEWFALLRFYVASQKGFSYCRELNERMLTGMGIELDLLGRFAKDLTLAPLDERLKLLLAKAVKSLEDSGHFNREDFEELYALSWSDKTIYEAISYATWFLGVAHKLDVYRIKEN